jgi:hypothetical protein
MISRGVRSVKAYINSNPNQFMGISLEFQESVRSLEMVLVEDVKKGLVPCTAYIRLW